MLGYIFDYHSATHGFHRWVVIKDIPDSRYCICAIISSTKNNYSIEINEGICKSIKKTSYVQLDNLLSIPKELIEKKKKEILCSSLLNLLKKKLNTVIK